MLAEPVSWTLWTKGDFEAQRRGWADPGPHLSQPCFLYCCGHMRRGCSEAPSSADSPSLTLLGVPSPTLLGCLTLTQRLLRKDGVWGSAGGLPTVPHPHTEPIVPRAQGADSGPLLSIHGHRASMGRPVPGASALPRGPAWVWGCSRISFLEGARVNGWT